LVAIKYGYEPDWERLQEMFPSSFHRGIGCNSTSSDVWGATHDEAPSVSILFSLRYWLQPKLISGFFGFLGLTFRGGYGLSSFCVRLYKRHPLIKPS
jgi:hypothetical protein